MKVDGGRGKLYDAQQTIRQRWFEIEGQWNDAVRTDFETNIWQPLDDLTSDELRALDRLARILTECRRACEGQRE
jgi:hypothetical protein